MISSLCAPTFTAEDDQEETAGLSADETIQIQEDVFGGSQSDDCDVLEGFADESLALMDQALRSLSPSEREAYDKAKLGAPHLIDTETNPIYFLRCEDYDPEVRVPAFAF